MSSAFDAVREILTLTENVRGLKDDLVRVTTRLDDLRERLVRLENREELVIEKTRNAAIIAVHKMHGDLLSRLIALEVQTSSPLGSKLLEPSETDDGSR